MMSIKVCCWNCKGLSNSRTLDRLKNIIHQMKPNIVSVLKDWNSHFSSSPMHVFTHFICRTKTNLIKWWVASLSNLEKEIHNIETEITNIESTEANSPDPWHQTWLRAFYNRHNVMLRQSSLFWA